MASIWYLLEDCADILPSFKKVPHYNQVSQCNSFPSSLGLHLSSNSLDLFVPSLSTLSSTTEILNSKDPYLDDKNNKYFIVMLKMMNQLQSEQEEVY